MIRTLPDCDASVGFGRVVRRVRWVGGNPLESDCKLDAEISRLQHGMCLQSGLLDPKMSQNNRVTVECHKNQSMGICFRVRRKSSRLQSTPAIGPWHAEPGGHCVCNSDTSQQSASGNLTSTCPCLIAPRALVDYPPGSGTPQPSTCA